MKQLERTITIKEDRIKSLRREIAAIEAEIQTLKMANDIVGGRINASPSIGDAVASILQDSVTPLDADQLLILLSEKGLTPKKKIMASVLRKDARERFIEVQPQVFKLSDNPKPVDALYARRNIKKVEGVTAGVRDAIRSIGISNEFTITDVMRHIENYNPTLWEQIKDNSASISPTLKRLANEGEIEIISFGKGVVPNKYKTRSSLEAGTIEKVSSL